MGSPTSCDTSKFEQTDGTSEHSAPATANSVKGPEVERANYAVSCKDLDYGIITARNQLIKRVFNPLMDMIENTLKPDHIVDSKTIYKLSIVVTSTRDIDTVQ